jgi:hypothetical protein
VQVFALHRSVSAAEHNQKYAVVHASTAVINNKLYKQALQHFYAFSDELDSLQQEHATLSTDHAANTIMCSVCNALVCKLKWGVYL